MPRARRLLSFIRESSGLGLHSGYAWCVKGTHSPVRCVTLAHPFQAAVTEKLLVCGLSLLFHLTISNMLPVEYNIDEHFQATASWPTKATYLYVSLLAARPKYYFAWTLGK